ncbi:RlpA-like double-psi beta-barrel domain-containing protein [Roseomonas sp. HF4]|uniref:RlpA-like double-psi beta-barrel domain-containing protein n=1 Tax=Roseomonas sp. HF4 TaxID=2562313 RepID=UPI001F0E868D|nr:RlpA-like double-psi beta-barrel domain-containing protein [Roseomonas sp. HF4]
MRGVVLLLAVLAAGCTSAPPRYLVGDAYRMGGVWSYPREDFALVETGLAVRHPGPGFGARTANDEAWSAGRALGAHRTLQLPAVVTVTNLENGRALTLRVNDRGPVDPGRVIGLSDRAANLLGLPAGGAAQVRLAVDGERSRALAEGRRPPPVEIAAAPRAAVATESLAPPPGARGAAPVVAAAAAGPAAVAAAPPPRDEPLPETVVQGSPQPGRLVIETATLGSASAAAALAARIPGARTEAFGPRRDRQHRVRLGPFASVREADAALERTRAAGVSGARILVD